MPLHLSFLLFAASLAAYGGERTVGQNDYSNSRLCQQSLVCGNNVDVRYPFFLADANGTAAFDGNTNTNTNTSSSNCGYPGMMIACEGGRATLKLMGDNYTVLDINYDRQPHRYGRRRRRAERRGLPACDPQRQHPNGDMAEPLDHRQRQPRFLVRLRLHGSDPSTSRLPD